MLLTVSPVPLAATTTDNQVLVPTTYSKSVLRSVAGVPAILIANSAAMPTLPSRTILN
ncbi:hypothetical protein [Paracoccus yeei]|uniref:hypothetical protein n=1 Tax=Paracoccus yeei TaxID=147645 RepID=UPI0030DB032C